jgi:hypothetical protein
MSIRNLDSLFEPTSIAVFGASLRAASVGATVWRNLTQGTYKGELVQDGVYMYQINFTYYDSKTYQFSGTLTLLK